MTTLQITHPQLVATLVKPPADIMMSLSLYNIDLWHGATGVSGEAGELLEAILFPPESGYDRVNLCEELGDLYFYIEQIVQRTGVVIDWDTVTLSASTIVPSGEGNLFFAASIAVHGSQILDTIKKAAIYNKALNLDLLTNQLNSICASILALGRYFDITHQECLDANITKLSKRYSSLTYSDRAAQDRADKQASPQRKPFPGEPSEDVVRRNALAKDA